MATNPEGTVAQNRDRTASGGTIRVQIEDSVAQLSSFVRRPAGSP